MDILTAINTLATKDMELIDEARHVVTVAVWNETETELDLNDDGFGDWIAAGSWDTCDTEEQAQAQINSAAAEWDELTEDFE